MNERIRQLAKQAEIDYELREEIARAPVWIGTDEELEKFAELIVRECIEVVEKQKAKMSYGPTFVIEDIKQYFGVEE